MPQFDATIKQFKDGVKSFAIAAAVKNIEGWEATLEKVEGTGAKSVIHDLESLKKQLQAKELDGEAIKKLIAKLGRETVAIAGKTEGENARKIKSLGEALTSASEEAA